MQRAQPVETHDEGTLLRANWSLWLDIKILLRTVPYALSRRGL